MVSFFITLSAKAEPLLIQHENDMKIILALALQNQAKSIEYRPAINQKLQTKLGEIIQNQPKNDEIITAYSGNFPTLAQKP